MNGIPALRRLADTIAGLATVPSRVAKVAAAKISGLLAAQFASGQDPYGAAWAPLLRSTIRRKGGDSRVLIRTGGLQAGTFARPVRSSGIEVTSLPFASYHQTGTGHMPPRPVLPGEGELPPDWEEVIDSEVRKAFRRTG